MPAPIKPIRQRTQYTCGAASLSMALDALGCTLCGEDKVNEVMGAAPMQGASWEQIAAAANHYGCRSTLVVPSTLTQVRQWTDAGKPVLIGWNPEGRPWSHASLVFNVTDTTVFVADPNCPDPAQTVREVSHADFYSKWAEEWNGYKVRRPAMLIDREVDADGRQVMASRRAAKKATSLTQPLSLRYDYGYKKDLTMNTSRLPEDVAITASELEADSDGSYMSVGYLKALADKSRHLLNHIHYDTPLPDWVEAKIGQAANAINAVHDYFEYRGDEGGEMKLEDHYTLLPQAVTAKFEEGKSVDVPKYLEEHGNPEAAKEWVEQNEANKDKFKSAGRKVAVDLPADVERYVEEIKAGNPDYDDAQAWATAWSIYCKYKNPNSEHCQMPTSEYFKAASELEAAWGETMADEATVADWEEGHVMFPAVSGPNTPPSDEWGSDTPDGGGNISKRARVLSRQESLARMNELEKKLGKDTKEWYDTVIKEVKEGVIAPAAVVGGGYKDNKKVALMWLEKQKNLKTASDERAEDDGVMAKFEKGKPADPTENMSPEDAAEWNKQKEEHKDQFKSARQRLSWSRKADLEEACWEGYEAIGMKELDGKQVPNCVPKQAAKGKKAATPSTVQGWLEWEE